MSIDSARLQSVAERFGTPLYVYDADVITDQIGRLRSAFSSWRDVHFHYAVKAASTQGILQVIERQGIGLDCVSIGEVHMGLRAGFTPDRIMFTPNGVPYSEIAEVAGLGVQLNLDNLQQLELFGREHPDVPVCVRINPHVMAGGNANISVGHERSKFGISVRRVKDILEVVARTGMRINGVHMHTGSDIRDVNAFLTAADALLDAASHFNGLDFIDFGSGFKVPYTPGDVVTDIEDLGRRLTARFSAFCERYGRELAMVFEPGKFIVSEAGTFLARVTVVKQTGTTTFAHVDSGFNHLIRPMFYNAYHAIENLTNPEGPPQTYDVVGYICETDTFARDRVLPEIRETDLLCFRNAGAYGFTMASTFNSRPRPAEVLVIGGRDHLIRRRETVEDLMANQIALPT